LGLTACPEQPPTPPPAPPTSNRYIRGTITAPGGGDLRGTEVMVCFVVNGQCDVNSANTRSQVLQVMGPSASYGFDKLVAGQYLVAAVKDVNANNEFDDGDYSGVYTNGGTVALGVAPPAQGISITLQVKAPGGTNPGTGSLVFLRPNDFVGGKASVTLSALGTQERVAVIPVHASQSPSVDGFQYSISTFGVAAQSLLPDEVQEPGLDSQTQGLLVEEPATVSTDAHLRQLESDLRWTQQLQQAGAKPLGGAGRVSAQATLGKCPGPYTVGSRQCSFWVRSGDTQQQITATLRHSSTNAYWFVQNEDASDFSQTELQGLANDFETKVVPADRQYFGDFSDVDQNGKVFIVFSRLLGPQGLLGYVLPADLYSDLETAPHGIRSNEGDIFYAATPGTIGGLPRSRYFGVTMPSTMVHELKHQIAVSTRLLSVPERPLEELWIEEGSAMAAQQLAGLGSQVNEVQSYARFGLAAPQDFRVVHAERPTGAEEGLSIYGYNFLLVWRAAEKKGHANFWKSWVAGPTSGMANLEAHTGTPFSELMLDWASTMMLDHSGMLTGYDYQGFNLRDGSWSMLGYSPLSASATGTARSMSYWVGRGTGGGATITVQARNSAQPYAVVMRLPGALPYGHKTLSGTLFAPPGASLQGAALVACHIVNGECVSGSPKTTGMTFTTTAQSSTFSLPVEPADYGLLAYKDVNGDGTLGAGDYSGCHGTSTGCTIIRVASNVSGLNVQMGVRTSFTGADTAEVAMWTPPRPLLIDPQPFFQALLSRAD
jgi:uncharacterized protein (DUF2141 family)